MSFFTSGAFWFLEGMLAVLAVIGLKTWAEDNSIPMPFWKWILFAAWLVFFGFTSAFVGTSLGEGEIHAAVIGGVVFGLAVLVTGAGLRRLIMLGEKRRRMTGTGLSR